jgi:hypothetical protein
MHTVAFHVSLSLIESLTPIVGQLRLMDCQLAHSLRRSAAAIPQALAAARLASRKATVQRHLDRALAQTRHVHALLLVPHAWHTWMPGMRQAAIARAQHLAELLGAPLI